MATLFAGILGFFILLIIGKIIGISLSILKKLIVNSIVGLIILFAFNLFSGIFGVRLEATFINALVVGFLGLPGIIILLLLR